MSADAGRATEVPIVLASADDGGFEIAALLVGGLIFACAGALLALVIGLTLRRAVPTVARREFIAVVGAGVPVTSVVLLGVIRWAVEGEFALSFVLGIRWQGWVVLLVATVAGLLLAFQLAPDRVRLDPSVFE